jgi:hypothetical protein
MSIRISETKDYFIKEGKKFFYLADTVWSAFSKTSIEEWEHYLDYRRSQNFNVLQINILKQFDAGEKDKQLSSFNYNVDRSIDFYSFNQAYFEKAQKMLDMAVKKGFTPALVVLWGNYVKDTWMVKDNGSMIMPYDAVKPYVEFVVKTFSRFDPIYMISGDTDFGSEETIKYYKTAMDTIKALSPSSLTTLHLCFKPDMPDSLVYSNNLDFYMYQSSHSIEGQYAAHQYARHFLNSPVKRPVVNGEPCYEGHGYGFKYGRFSAFDVRKAMWQSVLAGAKAGVTYGAHGIWSWHTKGSPFNGEAYASIPFDWKTALYFEGAWDAGYLRWVFETNDLFDILPDNDILINKTEEIITARNENKIVVYIPYSIDVKLKIDMRGFEAVMINLSNKKIFRPCISIEGDVIMVKMHDFNSDVLLIAEKK